MFCSVASCLQTTFSVSERAAASVAEWDASRRVGARLRPGMASLVRVRRDMSRKPSSCRHGGRSTRPWWDVLRPVDARQVGARCVGVCFGNHARAGTVLDQRQLRGMSCQGWFGLAQVRLVTFWKNHHAVGAVSASTPDGGMHLGMVRWVEVGSGKAWSGFYV